MMIPNVLIPSLQFPTARAYGKTYPSRKASVKHYLMRSDVKETDTMYILDIDLPGFEKEEIKVHLENGYLYVEAGKEKQEAAEEAQEGEKKQSKKYISKERFDGVYKRTFYIGSDIKQDEIKASYKHGVLKLHIPKVSKEEKEKADSIPIA